MKVVATTNILKHAERLLMKVQLKVFMSGIKKKIIKLKIKYSAVCSTCVFSVCDWNLNFMNLDIPTVLS